MSDTLYLEALCDPTLVLAPPPDLTGVNSQYYHAADEYAAYLTGQQIIFDQTLYQMGMVITPQGSTTPWVYGTDWTVNSDDVDTVATAAAVALLPSFSQVLLKSITILHRQADLPLFLNMATQSFYPRPENMPPLPDADNALTALLQNMIARLNYIESEVNQVEATTSGSSLTPVLLAFDINETNAANLITGETYSVNTYGGQNLIRPIQGSYFADSLVVVINGATLAKGTDYAPVGLNIAKTKRTTNASGIYDFILLTYDYTGPVQVTYHAVGGEASVSDLNAVYQNLLDIQNFLNTSGFLTADQLVTSPALQNILNKTCALENQMRALLSGPPNYGDTTNGVTVVKYLRAPDTNLHWWTIGQLYMVSGTTQIETADRMSLHIELVNAGLLADVGIAVNLDQATDILAVNAANIIQNVEFAIYGTPGTPVDVIVPQFRVVWDAATPYVSGAFLQIGLNLPNLTDTLAIEDRSGIESCWVLNTTLGTSSNPLTPTDSNFVLPDGSSVWGPTNTASVSQTLTMPNDQGYLVWAGTQSMTTFDNTVGKLTLTNTLPSWFRIQDIVDIVAEFQDASGNPSRVIFPITGLTASARRGTALIFLGQDGSLPVPMEVDLTYNSTAGTITVQIEVHVNMQSAPVTNLMYLVAKLGNRTL